MVYWLTFAVSLAVIGWALFMAALFFSRSLAEEIKVLQTLAWQSQREAVAAERELQAVRETRGVALSQLAAIKTRLSPLSELVRMIQDMDGLIRAHTSAAEKALQEHPGFDRD
jgi:hypothetical protein